MFKWVEKLVLRAVTPIMQREMGEWKEYLDLQHGLKYNSYADSLQESVYGLKNHIDKVKNITAQKLIEMEQEMREARETDRKVILKLREKIADLETRLPVEVIK